MTILKKLYDKSAVLFAVLFIVAYCFFMSLGDALSELLGIAYVFSLPISLCLSALILCFLKKYELFRVYGLCRSKLGKREMLFYLPFIVLLTANTWNGLKLNFGITETFLYIFTMLFVGFLEEIIFRGFLFDAMRKDGEGLAIAVSSITFGIGHIINLLNGAELLPTLLQLVYAAAAGFMFVAVFIKSKSLVPCIVTHGLFNALGAFSVENKTQEMQIISCAVLTVISVAYGVYLLKKINR